MSAGLESPRPWGGGVEGAERERLLVLWEDLLTLVADPDSGKLHHPDEAGRLLSLHLERSGIDREHFFKLDRSRRCRLFLSRFSSNSRALDQLEFSAFDLDRAVKERFLGEPLTVGAAWPHGLWRSSFSPATITHPAGDGLREGFSTAWDILRKPAVVLWRASGGSKTIEPTRLTLDLPILVGPLPYSDGSTLELAYLRAAAADPGGDNGTRTLVGVRAADATAAAARFAPFAGHLLPRFTAAELDRMLAGERDTAVWQELLREIRAVELVWHPGVPEVAARLLARWPHLILSVYHRYSSDLWPALAGSIEMDGVAMVQLAAGERLSYRLIPEADAFLKSRGLRNRVQLVNAGGDGDAVASAAAVYESILLGANGGAATDLASIALLPELIEVYHGADPEPIVAALAARDPETLFEQARRSLLCWRRSILDFLSCMGIDDVQKTSANAMAITLTADWSSEVDALATAAFAQQNRELNEIRILAEPVPAGVRQRFRVSSLMNELSAPLDLTSAARIQEQRRASWHLHNTNRHLGGDHLEVLHRMAAARLPQAGDFFLQGDSGPYSLDGVGLRLSRRSVEWACERLHRDPAALDYIQLAVPRGMLRPGAVAGRAACELRPAGSGSSASLARWVADEHGGFEVRLTDSKQLDGALARGAQLEVIAEGGEGEESPGIALDGDDHGAAGLSVVRASRDGRVVLKTHPEGGYVLTGVGLRVPLWQSPVSHGGISLGAAAEDFLAARLEANRGLAVVASGEGGPLRFGDGEGFEWQSLQTASAHYGIHAADLRRARDIEIKIHQGAHPGRGEHLAASEVTPAVSRARNVPVGMDATSPGSKPDIQSSEDLPAEVWLWLLYRNYCGVKITGSRYTRYVAAGVWSNAIVDYLLIDAGLAGSVSYPADSSHVGWADIFRTVLHTHHGLINEMVVADASAKPRPLRDGNGFPYGALGGTRLFAAGGIRDEVDMVKVLCAGADGVMVASIDKVAGFGCNQCGYCHLDCPRGGITTRPELTAQNDPDQMRRRLRNWTVLNLAKLAILIDAFNRESGAIDEDGNIVNASLLIRDIRALRGRVDLLELPLPHPPGGAGGAPAGDPASTGGERELDACRTGTLVATEPVDVAAVWEAARVSRGDGNNRGGGIAFAGFAPATLAEKTCLVLNTIGPDRADTLRQMLDYLAGCRFFDAGGRQIPRQEVRAEPGGFRFPIHPQLSGENGWRQLDLREDPGDFHTFFVDLDPEVLGEYARRLAASPQWFQRQTRFGDRSDEELLDASYRAATGALPADEREAEFLHAVREEYFTVLCHILDSRFYRVAAGPGAPAGKYATRRRGYVVSVGEDLAAIKISGWTHRIPEYFDFGRFWAAYPGTPGGVEQTGKDNAVRSPALLARVWAMHHRYPSRAPVPDPEGRGHPATAHPMKSYNLLLLHNGQQAAVESTAPLLAEYGHVHVDSSMGPGAKLYAGDSVYERKVRTDTEYAAALVDFTRRVLGLSTAEAAQILTPLSELDLRRIDEPRRSLYRLLAANYVQLSPTGSYKFTALESRPAAAGRRLGVREITDRGCLRPHEIVLQANRRRGGVTVAADASEARIADAMIRTLHEQGVLADAGSDRRFHARPGGVPGQGDIGGVVEITVDPGDRELGIRNRFGEEMAIERAGERAEPEPRPAPRSTGGQADGWRSLVDGALGEFAELARAEAERTAAQGGTLYGPESALPAAAADLVSETLERLARLSYDDYRYLVEAALPTLARSGDPQRALALRLLTELRKRLIFSDPGGKSLSSLEYLTDGGRVADGSPEGGIYRILDAVPAITAAHGRSRYLRITQGTRDDLVAPADPLGDVLVIDFRGFASEGFDITCASRFLSEAVRAGWRRIVGYDLVGGPRYLGTNLAWPGGQPARGVEIEFYGREHGDFLGALLEGARIYLYGQAQSHAGMKADSGRLFLLQDALHGCAYSAHGFTVSVWDSGARFAAAGQNKVMLEDGISPASGFKSVHMGSPGEFAFEFLMAGGDNSCHVVLGLDKPDARGRIRLRRHPFAGNYLLSGATAGRLFLFDPDRHLEPQQYRGTAVAPISRAEWERDVVPLINAEAWLRGAPIRAEGDRFTIRLGEQWRGWAFPDAFIKLVPAAAAPTRSGVGKGLPDPDPKVGE